MTRRPRRFTPSRGGERSGQAARGVAGCTLLLSLALGLGTTALADLSPRRHILIVGSSTAYPIVGAAAEHLRRSHGNPAPVVEATGTGGGFKAFCAGVGLETPDIAMASRRMRPTERAECAAHGVTAIGELHFGQDGIVFANARGAPRFDLTARDLYLALARDVPDPSGRPRLVANPYQRWREVNRRLPDLPIRVLGPPPTSGTRDLLVERVSGKACAEVPFLLDLRASDPVAFAQSCRALREDGAYVETGENEARLVRKLADDRGALGVLGYNFLERNADKLQAASIDGARPEPESIENGSYPLSRPLYLYVKQAHLARVPGLSELAGQLGSDDVIGPDGYLADYGLIPR